MSSAVIITNADDLPYTARLVVMTPKEGRHLHGEISLPDFHHPCDAIYLFGSDSTNLSEKEMGNRVPDNLVYIPTRTNDEMFSFVAAAIMLYDISPKGTTNSLKNEVASSTIIMICDDNSYSLRGKETIGTGLSNGVTATLQDTLLAFDARKSWASSGTITTSDILGKTLTDSVATFQTDGVKPGSWIVNMTDFSICSVVQVLSETRLLTDVLGGGTSNQFTSADVYRVLNVVQCVVDGGNVVAVDGVGSPVNPILPTAGTQVVVSASSSATLLTAQVAQDVWDHALSLVTQADSLGEAVLKLLQFRGLDAANPVAVNPLAGTAVAGGTTLTGTRVGEVTTLQRS